LDQYQVLFGLDRAKRDIAGLVQHFAAAMLLKHREVAGDCGARTNVIYFVQKLAWVGYSVA
jgi:hypothetical protein